MTAKMKIAMLFLGSFLILPSVRALDLDLGDYVASRNKEVTKQYVAGLGEGLYWSNVQLEKLRQPKLFCTPKHLKLNTSNYVNILEQQIARIGLGKNSLMPLVAVMFDGLVRTFPCTEK